MAGILLPVAEWLCRRVLHRDVSLIRDPDHRLRPTARGNNSDGIRCKAEAQAFREEDLNIIFLGDSFVYGLKQKPDVAFPQRFESIVRARHPRRGVNVANFGWISSSPYLSLRLLRDLGAKYKPDVVFLCIDMTDFHDDLKYRGLVEQPTAVYKGLAHVPGIIALTKRILVKLRVESLHQSLFGYPADRFFIVNQPLSQSRPFCSVMLDSIRRIDAYTRNELNARFILVILPRSFQYSDRECPENWEADAYEVLGPHVLEPFVLFEAWKKDVDFPVYSLLKDFQTTDVFPTCLHDDPHWTQAGHAMVAERLYRIAKAEGLLPGGRAP